MKRSISIVSLLFSALILTSCSMGSMMFHEQKSPYDFDKTVATIQTNAKAQGWVVPKVYDFQKSLLKANQPDPGKITVLKLCHPEIAAKMLARDETKFVSVMMPCSVSVYEKQDGSTYVASMNMGLMSKVMGDEIGILLKRVAKEDAAIFAFLD